jgi:hypothetical protein
MLVGDAGQRRLPQDGCVAEKLSLSELFALFGRGLDQTRWLASAESEEYLALVSYLVERTNNRGRWIV